MDCTIPKLLLTSKLYKLELCNLKVKNISEHLTFFVEK